MSVDAATDPVLGPANGQVATVAVEEAVAARRPEAEVAVEIANEIASVVVDMTRAIVQIWRKAQGPNGAETLMTRHPLVRTLKSKQLR